MDMEQGFFALTFSRCRLVDRFVDQCLRKAIAWAHLLLFPKPLVRNGLTRGYPHHRTP